MSFEGDKYFQARFEAIIFGGIQIENNKIIESNPVLAAIKVVCYQRTQAQTDDDNTD